MNIWKLSKVIFSTLLMTMLPSGAKVAAEQCCETFQYCENNMCSADIGGFKVWGEFIYWKAVQDQTQYAAVLPGGIQSIVGVFDNQPVKLAATLDVTEQSFKYKPGFRVGLGYVTPCSDWDFSLGWTSLHEKVTSKVVDENNGVIPLEFPVGILFGLINRDPSEFSFGAAAQSRWKFQFDVIDFEIGKNLCFVNSLKFRPYVGIKLASIKQNQHIEYLGFSSIEGLGLSLGAVNPIDLTVKRTNDFRGIGPSLGFDASWEFYRGFNLTSGVCGALLCGKFDVQDRPLVLQDLNSISLGLKDSKQTRVRPAVNMDIGIDWNTCLYEQFYVAVGVSYEVQYWWNQWQVPPTVVGSLLTGSSSPDGDLMMQGVTIKAALLF